MKLSRQQESIHIFITMQKNGTQKVPWFFTIVILKNELALRQVKKSVMLSSEI